ncbi:SAM-dependent methyltransferase [Saccharopolyspora erythraea D]|nr:SAM-dependent methyltransferase [Saccharopolyspora erythraea D]
MGGGRTVRRGAGHGSAETLHSARTQALSFGDGSDEYDRTRPRYPDELILDLVADKPERALDIGTGTGVVGRQLQPHVPEVVGIEPDERMRAVARRRGLRVENATFESWQPGSRTFDLVVSGQAWHWVEPEEGTRKVASVLVAGGRFGVFWNFARPSEQFLAVASPVYRRHAPELAERTLLLGNDDGRVSRTAGRLRESGQFHDVSVSTYPSSVSYTPREWVDHIGTWSDHRALPGQRAAALGAELAEALAGLGAVFDMDYANVLVSARKQPRASGSGQEVRR